MIQNPFWVFFIEYLIWLIMHDPITQKYLEDTITKVEDAIKYIQELEALDLSKLSDAALEKIIQERFPILPYTSCTIKSGTELFRARINQKDKRFTKVQELYARESNKVNSYGRAHRPHERVFYCASNALVAAFEVIQDLKSAYVINPVALVTVGIWRVKEDLHLTNIIHSSILHNLRKDILEDFENHQKLLNNGLEKGQLSKHLITSHNLICQFFAGQYTKSIKNEHDYKISAHYASQLKSMNNYVAPENISDRFDGVLYPSVPMKYTGDNQALFIEAADSKLEITNAIEMVCANINFESGEFLPGILHEADLIQDGVIKWKEELFRAEQK